MLKNFLLSSYINLSLLVLRIGVGLLLAFSHGLGKLKSFGERFHTFADPIGMGPEVSYLLTVGTEFFCALFIVVGLFTRLVAIPIVILFLIILFVVHADDEWGKKEFVLLYLIPSVTLMLAGGGKYSLDYLLFSRKK